MLNRLNPRLARLLTAALTFFTLGVGLPSIAQAAPSVTLASAEPAQVVVGQSAHVRFSADIADPSLIAGSINLERVWPAGTNPTIVGKLHDDGINGDAIAGDKRYSIEVTLNELTATQVTYRISAAFKGLLQRVKSNNIFVSVTPPPESIPVPGEIKTFVALDPAIPAAIATSIVKVSSPTETTTLGSLVTISTTGFGGESIILALDAGDNIVLASLANTSMTNLSSDSTALVLARLAIGPIPAGLSAPQVSSFIRSSSEYVNLVATISQSLNRGTSPSVSPAVLQSVAAVAVQVAPMIAAAITPSIIKAAAVISNDKVTASLPFTVIVDVLRTSPVQIVGSSGYAIHLTNDMPIPWTAISTSALGVERDRVFIPASGFFKAGNGYVLGEGGKGFNLTVKQTFETSIDTLADVVSKIFNIATVAIPASTCTTASLKAEVVALLKGYNPSATTWGQFANIADSMFTPTNVLKLTEKCVPTPKYQALADFLKPINQYIKYFHIAQAGYDAYTLIGQISYAKHYFLESRTVGVCQDELLNIINCANSFVFTPKLLRAQVGVNLKLHTKLTAFDAKKDPTAIPAGLKYSATDGGLFLDIDAATGDTLTKKAGSSSIIVTDPATGAVGGYDVFIDDPGVISPSTLSLKVGETGYLNLTDGFGNALIRAPGTTWKVTDEGVAQIDLGSILFTGKIGFIAKGPGTTTVTVTNPVTGKQAVAVITVVAPNMDSREGWYVGSYTVDKWANTIAAPYVGATGKIWIYIFKDTKCHLGFCVATFSEAVGDLPNKWDVSWIFDPTDSSSSFYNRFRSIWNDKTPEVESTFMLGWATLQPDGSISPAGSQGPNYNDGYWWKYYWQEQRYLYTHKLNWSARYAGLATPPDFPGLASFTCRYSSTDSSQCTYYGAMLSQRVP